MDGGPRGVSLDMHQNSHDPSQGAGHIDLLSAQQRYIAEADLSGASGRKPACKVRRRSQDDAHHLGCCQSVSVEHRGEQFTHRIAHFGRIIGLEADCSANSAHPRCWHGWSLQTGFGIQRPQFRPDDVAHHSRALLSEEQRPDPGAHEVLHRKADLVEHPSHDAVTALVNHYFDH